MSKLIPKTNEPSTGAVRLPRDSYKLRITEEPVFKMSKNGNPMLLFKLELVEPPIKKIDGEDRKIAGLEFNDNCMLTEKGAFKLEQLHKAAKLQPPSELDVDDSTGLPIGISYTGLEVWAICNSEEAVQKNESGEPIMNPASGEPLKSNFRRVDQYLS